MLSMASLAVLCVYPLSLSLSLKRQPLKILCSVPKLCGFEDEENETRYSIRHYCCGKN